MSLFSAKTEAERSKVARYLKRSIKAPFVSVVISTLGGVHRASAMIKVSLDNRAKWKNGIYENSRYFQIDLGVNGVVEQFSRSHKILNMRKTRAKTLAEAVAKINAYIKKAK